MKKNPFRKLRDDELDTVLKAGHREHAHLDKVDGVNYVQQGNFTVAVFKTTSGIRIGVAKRNPTDNLDPIRAETIALYRAVCAKPLEV